MASTEFARQKRRGDIRYQRRPGMPVEELTGQDVRTRSPEYLLALARQGVPAPSKARRSPYDQLQGIAGHRPHEGAIIPAGSRPEPGRTVKMTWSGSAGRLVPKPMQGPPPETMTRIQQLTGAVRGAVKTGDVSELEQAAIRAAGPRRGPTMAMALATLTRKTKAGKEEAAAEAAHGLRQIETRGVERRKTGVAILEARAKTLTEASKVEWTRHKDDREDRQAHEELMQKGRHAQSTKLARMGALRAAEKALADAAGDKAARIYKSRYGTGGTKDELDKLTLKLLQLDDRLETARQEDNDAKGASIMRQQRAAEDKRSSLERRDIKLEVRQRKAEEDQNRRLREAAERAGEPWDESSMAPLEREPLRTASTMEEMLSDIESSAGQQAAEPEYQAPAGPNYRTAQSVIAAINAGEVDAAAPGGDQIYNGLPPAHQNALRVWLKKWA